MQTFAERSRCHANVLEVLCGHMATVVDGALHRVLKAELPEQKDQAAHGNTRRGSSPPVPFCVFCAFLQ